jgi:hypothetical protein
MRQPTTTLEAIAPNVTLVLAQAYNVLLEENGDPLLDELGNQLAEEAFAVKVALDMVCPSVTLELRENT